MRREEYLSLDPVIGTPGAIPDKVRVLSAATATTAASPTATTTPAAASREASSTAWKAARAASAGIEVATAATTAAATTTASSRLVANRATDTAGPVELALIATREAAILAKATGVKSREIRLIGAQSIAHRAIHHERFVGAIRGHLRRECARIGLGGKIWSCIG